MLTRRIMVDYIYMIIYCRGGITADAIGLLSVGADGRWRLRGGLARVETYTVKLKHTTIYPGSGPS